MTARDRAVVEAARLFVEAANEDSEQDQDYWTPSTVTLYERLVRAVVVADRKPREPVRKGGGI